MSEGLVVLSWNGFSSPHCPPPQIAVLIGIAHALVIYRVVVTALFTQSDSEFFREQANTVAVMTGAVLHYLTIVIMTKVQSVARGGWWWGLPFFSPSSTLPSCFTPLSCRSTGVWPSFSVTWVRETGGCPLPAPAPHSGTPTPWSPNAARLMAPSLPPPLRSISQAALAMQVPKEDQQPVGGPHAASWLSPATLCFGGTVGLRAGMSRKP